MIAGRSTSLPRSNSAIKLLAAYSHVLLVAVYLEPEPDQLFAFAW